MKSSGQIALAAAIAALVTTPILAQQQERLPRECRQEIMQLCEFDGRPDRTAVRACLRERASELSETCRAEIRKRMQQRSGEHRGAAYTPAANARVAATAFYGEHPRQVVDYFAAKDGPQTDRWDNLPPLVLFIHGGGWSFGNHKISVQSKPMHFTTGGFAFASAGYRVLPDAPVEQQAEDIGTAIGVLRAQAEDLGFDADRVVLMGHSAGAHLAALVSTDPRYAGDAFNAITGTVLLDGAGYDIGLSMASATGQSKELYSTVFGDDPSRHSALSPSTHVGGLDAPNWLILYVEDRERSRDQSQMLARQLEKAGASAIALAVSNTDHGRLNREIGTNSGVQQTQAIDAFLNKLFG